ncbi:MAG: 50S ribosomal protein L25 [Chloroflexi bacterium]|nr:50S ribosomal protein L25 [Chloroflexota bacterium]
MATLELHAQARRVLGKKVRFLRRQGTIPANLYSKGTNSMPMQVDTGDLEKLLSHHGGGGIISLKLEGEKHPRSVVVRELQRDALTGGLIHVDLQQVSMAEEIKVEVPVVLIGEAKLAKTTAATVIQTVNSLMVRCLPRQIPEQIEVDISGFTEPGQAIHLKDLKLGEGVVALADPEEALAKVVAARIEVEKVEVAAEVVAAAPEAGAKAGATE